MLKIEFYNYHCWCNLYYCYLFLDSQKRQAEEVPPKQPPKKKQSGGKPVARYSNLNEANLKKRCVIPIRNVDDGLCCASAIVMALERYGASMGEYNKYEQYRQAHRTTRPSNVQKFTSAARYLHELAGKIFFSSLFYWYYFGHTTNVTTLLLTFILD